MLPFQKTQTMKILYYECFSGISGDMHLGAMVDLGVPEEYLAGELKKLGLSGYELRIEKKHKNKIYGSMASVILDDDQARSRHRSIGDIEKIITKSNLGKGVRDRSMKMFRILGEAEAKIHNKSIEEIHFHEVGAVDSIIDIVGAAICIEYIKPDKIISSPVELGGGFVKCAHGTLPVPAPATAEILKNIPVRSGAADSETTTPTGAAILAANTDEFTDKKQFVIKKTAYGVGHRDLPIPNLLRIYLGEPVSYQKNKDDLSRHEAILIECNIDDMNPEIYGYTMDLLFAAGADDVFITPIMMKKVRPASKLSVLCRREIEHEMEKILLSNTSSIGLRKHFVEKAAMQRKYETLKTHFGPVRIKTAYLNGHPVKTKPEFDDCRKLAEKHQVSFQAVYNEAIKKLYEKKEKE